MGHTLTHRYVSIHQQHCGTPAICCVGCAACQKRRRYYCMAGASTRSQQREEVQLCICVYTAFPPRNSDARVSGVCSHMLVHPISPFGPNAMSAANRLRTDCRIEKAHITRRGYGEVLRSCRACWTHLKPKCNTRPADLSWKPARCCLSLAYSLLKQLCSFMWILITYE